MKQKIIPYGSIFIISGLIYTMLELIWRGRTHWTMFLCAGLCGLVMANINNNLLEFDTDFLKQVLVSALCCTTFEFLFGIIFNGDFSIWDYRGLWGTIHVLGDQVNILFFGIWIIISFFSLPFLDWLQWKLGLAEKPYYRIGWKYFYPWERKE